MLVNSIYRFPPQMVFFTTPELLEIGGLPFVSPYEKPTRAEALQLLPQGRRHLRSADRLSTRTVLSVPMGRSPRSARHRRGDADRCSRSRRDRRAACAGRVTRATSCSRSATTITRCMLGVPGEDLPHVHHYYGEPHPYYRQRVVVVGGGNSAAESALEMFRAGAHVTLVHRRAELKSTIKYWVRPDIENRIKEGSIAARFGSCVKEIRPTSCRHRARPRRVGRHRRGDSCAGRLLRGVAAATRGQTSIRAAAAARRRDSGRRRVSADRLSRGLGPDARAGVALTEREAPGHDPETFETNVPGLFVAGGAIAGVDTGTDLHRERPLPRREDHEVIAGRSRT